MAALTAVEAMDSSLVTREGRGGPLGLFSAGVLGMLPKLGGLDRVWVLPCRDCAWKKGVRAMPACKGDWLSICTVNFGAKAMLACKENQD